VLGEGTLKRSVDYQEALEREREREREKKSVKQGFGVFYMKIKSDYILSINIKSLSQIKGKRINNSLKKC